VLGWALPVPPGRHARVAVVAATCSSCGTSVPEPPLSWSSTTSERGVQWLCESCVRVRLRAIEGRLDEAWW